MNTSNDYFFLTRLQLNAFRFIFLSLLVFHGVAWAKYGKHQMKYYAPFDNGVYNPDTLATVKGAIIKITTVNAPMTPLISVPTIALIVQKEDKSRIVIQLGPYWFMMSRPFYLKIGQEVKAEGSLMGPKENQYLVAKKIVADDLEEDYRNDFGIPVWNTIGDYLGNIEWEE